MMDGENKKESHYCISVANRKAIAYLAQNVNITTVIHEKDYAYSMSIIIFHNT